ncbi:MAG: sigma 54-interacting transcriptional regulator, partial [Gammaproteobacteria bacterium]
MNLCNREHFDMDTDFGAILGECVQGHLSAVTAADTADPFDPIVGESDAVRVVIDAARRVARCSVPVLIGGETGSGKTLLAAAIHNASPRRGRPFIAQNCGSLQETLCESELFGHKRGAFSGAVQDKKGLVEAADGGTLFLDEVSELSPALQVKLLQV